MEITEENVYFLISRLLDDFEYIKKDYTKHLIEEGYGVTCSQLEILKAICDNPGLSLGELATLMRLHITTVEGYVNRLKRKGFVDKMKDPKDTRRVVVCLSTAGEQVVKAAPSGYLTKLFEELKKLPLEEKRELYEVLKKVVFLMR
jgi:DNA-binding MarR family transcriptional regulator